MSRRSYWKASKFSCGSESIRLGLGCCQASETQRCHAFEQKIIYKRFLRRDFELPSCRSVSVRPAGDTTAKVTDPYLESMFVS